MPAEVKEPWQPPGSLVTGFEWSIVGFECERAYAEEHESEEDGSVLGD